MKIRIHRSCALAFISVLWFFLFSAQEDLQGQTSHQPSDLSHLRAKTGKTRKAHAAADTPAHYTYEVLYNFCSLANCADGDQIAGGLIRDAAGNLYGIASSGGSNDYAGTVFELDASGTETTLYSFCSKPNCTDGKWPTGLILDSAGNLYGTAQAGGANVSSDALSAGVVFELAPPAQPGGAWTETVLYNFCSANKCSDGFHPLFGIIQDAAGNLYGTTLFGGAGDGYSENTVGTVFQLSPSSQPGGTWTETVLHAFCPLGGNCNDGQFPYGNLIQDAAGNLYGTTLYSGMSNAYGVPGTAFEVSPPSQPGGTWTETVLYYFCSLANCADGVLPQAGVIMDTAGNLYGTTALGGLNYDGHSTCGGGTVFELVAPVQPGGAWSETVLYAFCPAANCTDGEDPNAALTLDAAGNLFGTTAAGGANQSGTAFELSPPAQPGGAWTETVLYSFCSAGGTNCTDGQEPKAGLLGDPVGNLYGTTWDGGSQGGGTLFTLAVPSFTVTGTSVSLSPGAAAGNTSTITLYPHGGFTGNVTLAAAITSEPAGAQNLPTLSLGASNPLSITSASPVTAILTITTTAPKYAAVQQSVPRGFRRHSGGMALAVGLIVGIGICIPMPSRAQRKRLGLLLFLVIVASGLLSCSAGNGGGSTGNSSPGTSPGTYVVTITGTSGSITVKGTVSLIVE